MKRIFLSVFFAVAATTSLNAETVFFGYWDGGKPKEFPSTIQFLADKNLAYCIQKQCKTYKYTGNSKHKFKFKTNGGRWSFRRTSETSLKGIFLIDGGAKYNIVMKVR